MRCTKVPTVVYKPSDEMLRSAWAFYFDSGVLCRAMVLYVSGGNRKWGIFKDLSAPVQHRCWLSSLTVPHSLQEVHMRWYCSSLLTNVLEAV